MLKSGAKNTQNQITTLNQGINCSLCFFMISGEITGKTVGQVAIICRSNYTVFNEAVKKCCFRDQDNIKIGFVGVNIGWYKNKEKG